MRLHAVITALLLATVPLHAADLVVAGSDLLGEKFSAGLNDFAQRTGLALKLKLTGSRTGLDSLKAGQADLALLVFSPQETPPGAPFVVRPAAYHTIVVVVPASLPLEQVSIAQLRALYGENGDTLSFKTWDALGVPITSEWNRVDISPVISGSGGGLSYDLFRYGGVLPSPGLRNNVVVEQDGAAALQRISGVTGGIAIVPALPPEHKDLKVLPVARGKLDQAFGPTPDNLFSGDYPVRLPLQIVFRADAAKRLLPLLRFLYGDDAVPLWQDAQLVPLPPQARANQVAEFEAM